MVNFQPSLLLLDELGYLPIDKRGADPLFQVVAPRHETGSIVLFTNRPFRGWRHPVRCGQHPGHGLDRPADAPWEAIVIQGSCYRMKDKDTNPPSA
jgi:hypothetical protein